jgi:hypothetical protein
MASGHVNRIKRPNTWLHRPMLQNVKKALANPEPSQFESVMRTKAEVERHQPCDSRSECLPIGVAAGCTSRFGSE